MNDNEGPKSGYFCEAVDHGGSWMKSTGKKVENILGEGFFSSQSAKNIFYPLLGDIIQRKISEFDFSFLSPLLKIVFMLN